MHVSPQISKILVSSSEFILDDIKDIKSEIAQLKLNSIVDAVVLKNLPGGKAKLTIKGQTVIAKTHALLTEGEGIKLKVVADGATKVLKLVPKNNEQFVPQGLKETKAFGRSGLYGKLTKILDEYLPPASKQVLETLAKNDVPPVIKKGPSGMKSPNISQEASTISKPAVSIEIKPNDMVKLKQLVANRNITWPEKVASIILNAEVKSSPAPPKMVMELAEKLVAVSVKEPVTMDAKPVLAQLDEINEKMGQALQPKDKALLNTVVKDQRLPWEYKLLTVLSVKKKPFQAIELAPVQKMLTNTLVQRGYKIPLEFLPENNIDINGDLSEPKSIHTAKKLKALLEDMSVLQGRDAEDEVLKTVVKSSGLVWEKKLSSIVHSRKEPIRPADVETLINGDVKALAMKLAEAIGHENKSGSKILKSFVDGLEKMQLLNSHSGDESGRYLLPLPFFLNDTLKFGQLLVDLDKDHQRQSERGEKAIRVAFILELSKLGHLKADFSMYKKSISGEFGVENEEIQSLFHELIPGLTRSLEKKTYEVKRIGCSVISSGELAGTSLTDMVTDHLDGVLNIVV